MNWIDKLERRYGNLGIPNLINGLLIGQLAAGIIMLFFNRDFGSLLMLSRTYVLHGQIWRLITFLFQPIWLGGVFGVLNLLFYYWLGNALARVWGDFRTTLFLALGMLGAWVSCFLTGYAGPSAIFQSMLFAFIAISKLALYIDCFGLTPLRVQSTWLVCVLLLGCVCALYTHLTGKKSMRAWMIFGAVTLAGLCMVQLPMHVPAPEFPG